MEKQFKLIGCVIALIMLPLLSFGQYSIGAGASTYLGLNISTIRYGFNVYGEFPRSNRNTFAIRATYMLPVKVQDIATVSGKLGVSPAMADATRTQKTTFFSIDGGTRYYFVNDYDIGFSVFAGGYLKGILSSYSASYRMEGNLDPDDYVIGSSSQELTDISPKYSVLFGFGGIVGVKYNLPTRGAIVFDLGIEFVSRLMDPYGILGYEISPLSMHLNLAYRFDWY